VIKLIETLSVRLTERYGKGFSKPVLWSFRQFYLTYPDRAKILFPAGRELSESEKLSPTGRELTYPPKSYPMGTKQAGIAASNFFNFRHRNRIKK